MNQPEHYSVRTTPERPLRLSQVNIRYFMEALEADGQESAADEVGGLLETLERLEDELAGARATLAEYQDAMGVIDAN